MALINRDALLEHLYNKQTEQVDIALEIAEFPTVDAVPVVRCRDCNNRECEGREGLIVCGIDGTSHPKDYFCADGERRSCESKVSHPVMPTATHQKPRAIYISFSPHDCESLYDCPVCGRRFGSWSICNQKKNENGTEKYCPECKTELAGLD